MDSSLDIEFPFLEQQDLYLLALGSYQHKLAPSYYAQHSGNAENIIQIYRDQDILKSVLEQHSIICEEPYLLRGRIHSRHSNKTKYFFKYFTRLIQNRSSYDYWLLLSMQEWTSNRWLLCSYNDHFLVFFVMPDGKHHLQIQHNISILFSMILMAPKPNQRMSNCFILIFCKLLIIQMNSINLKSATLRL